MKYNELVAPRQKKGRQVGRGISAGRGKTAGRGTKGQGARKSPTKFGFEGGQMPLHMRIPKLRGFKSHRSVAESVYTGQLEALKKPAIDTAVLFEAGLISSPHVRVKLLLNGELTSKKIVKLQAASKNAIQAVEKAGGSFSLTEQVARPVTSTKKSEASK
jgi:large subunit ribosomal protein L15